MNRSATPPRSAPRGAPARGPAPAPPGRAAAGRPGGGGGGAVAQKAGAGNVSCFRRCCPDNEIKGGRQSAVGCCILLYAVFCFVASFTAVRSLLSHPASSWRSSYVASLR